MDYKDLVTADLRLVILMSLQQDSDYSHNEFVLHRMASALGHAVSIDKFRTELHWLAEQELVRINLIGDVHVLTLTQRGEDVALGRTVAPGIQRPRPS